MKLITDKLNVKWRFEKMHYHLLFLYIFKQNKSLKSLAFSLELVTNLLPTLVVVLKVFFPLTKAFKICVRACSWISQLLS